MRRLWLLILVAGLAPLIGRLRTVEPGRLVSALHQTQMAPSFSRCCSTARSTPEPASPGPWRSARRSLGSDDRGGAAKLAPSLLVIHAANSLLPAHAGDVLHSLLLRRHGYPFGAVVATQAMEARAALE